jgi:hypothetical protein
MHERKEDMCSAVGGAQAKDVATLALGPIYDVLRVQLYRKNRLEARFGAARAAFSILSL